MEAAVCAHYAYGRQKRAQSASAQGDLKATCKQQS